MEGHDTVTRRQFLATGAAGALALASSTEAMAQTAAAQKFHAKPVPGEIFIDHGINQETRLETLRGYLTPASHFFVRQHATTPVLDIRTWRLRVEGDAVERPIELSFEDLLRLPSRSVIAYIECAGNGRGFFKEFMGKVASGTQWRFGGIGVAEWTGVPLGAVLELAKVKRDTPRDILNVLVEGLDSVKVQPADLTCEGVRGGHAAGVRVQWRAGASGPRLSGASDRPRLGRHQQHQMGRTHRGAQQRDRRPHHDQDVRAGRPRLSEQGRAARADDQERGGLAVGCDAAGGSAARAWLRLVAGRSHQPRRIQSRPRSHVAAGLLARAQHRPGLGPLGLRVGRPSGRSRDPHARGRRSRQRAAGHDALECAGLRL